MKSKVTAVILAAGQGKRMNSPVAKQFLMLLDKPVIYYALKAFERSSVDEIILVTGKGQTEYCKENIVGFYKIDRVTRIIEGGDERYDSVYRALSAACDADYVLVHDGARPFITTELIEQVIEQVMIHKACIVGTPVKETVKMVDEDGYITATPDRRLLWSAQTPQAFDYLSLRMAYDMLYRESDKSTLGITDDAMVYEKYLKRPVKMIMGDYNNIKLTTPEDLIYAEEILKRLLCEQKKQFL